MTDPVRAAIEHIQNRIKLHLSDDAYPCEGCRSDRTLLATYREAVNDAAFHIDAGQSAYALKLDAEDKLREAVELLREHQWAAGTLAPAPPTCPECRNLRRNMFHAPGCRIAAVIGE